MKEVDIEEMESLSLFIKYLIKNPYVKDYELWDGLKRLEKVGIDIQKGEIDENRLNGILELDDLKALVEMFMIRVCRYIEEKHGNKG